MKKTYQPYAGDDGRAEAVTGVNDELARWDQHYDQYPVGLRWRAALYARKSTATEGKSKSIEEQEKEGRVVARMFGADLADDHIYKEAEGMKGDWAWEGSGLPGPYRPELARLMRDVEAGRVNMLILWRTDRLYRDAGVADVILKRLKAKGVRLIASRHDYAIHTAAGYANASAEAVRNREMRDKVSEDIRRDLEFKAKCGQITRSPACLGFRSAGTDTRDVLPVPDELALVNRIFKMFVAGEDERGPLGVTAIAKQLASEGIRLPCVRRPDKNPHLAEIGAGKIRRVLEHVAYVARWRHNGVEYECPSLMIPAADGVGGETAVPMTLWQAAQEKLSRETKWDKRCDGLGTPHLLTGLVCCGGCGRTAYAAVRRDKQRGEDAPVKANYHCKPRYGDRPCVDGRMRRVDEGVLEAWVFGEVAPLLVAEAEAMRTCASRDQDAQTLATLKRQLEEARLRETNTLRKVMDKLDGEQFASLAGELRGERQALERQVRAAEGRLAADERPLDALTPERLAGISRNSVRAYLQAALRWVAVCKEGVVVLTRAGNYIGARFRRGDREVGEHGNMLCLEPASPLSALTCLTWFTEPANFIQGRRELLGDAGARHSDDELLPGIGGAGGIGDHVAEFDVSDVADD